MKKTSFVTVLALGLFFNTHADATTYTFSELTSWGSSAPPATDGSTVAVSSNPGGWLNRISTFGYNAASTPTLVAEAVSASWWPTQGTTIPGSSVGFTRVGPPSISDGAIAFAGSGGFDATSAKSGVFTNLGGVLKTVADLQTTVPGSTGTFSYFDEQTVIMRGDAVVFSAADAGGKWGVYRSQGGVLEKLIDADTPPPSSPAGQPPNAPFGYFSDTDYRNGSLAFQSGNGIFVRRPDGSLDTIVAGHTAIPDDPSGGLWVYMWDIHLAADDVVFKWGSDWGIGVYRWNDSTGMTNIVDRTAGLAGIGEIATDAEGNLAFELGDAIYIDEVSDADPYLRLIGSGDQLAGKVLSRVDMSDQGLGDGTVAFKAYFGDGSSGLFLANPVTSKVPEPASLALMLIALGLLAVSARRETAMNPLSEMPVTVRRVELV